jgi:glycosyltransferase involved in cell wall biosynthesis
MTSICLCMIVRDEAAVIERCLRSVRGLIQTWVICDTGSSDLTGELIADVLDGIPGELNQSDWVDFGHNRTDLMERAYGRADYLLLIDADMTITYEHSHLRAITADSYLLRHDENPEYWVKRLVRGDRRWRFVGPTHEYIITDGPERTEKLDGIVIHHHADGGTRPEKFERDLALLSADLERNPEDARSVFYLAQTYRDLDRLEAAIELYRRRALMGGWAEEVFYSQYQVGVLSERVGNHAWAVASLLEAWAIRPSRAEPLYELAWMLRARDLHHPAHMIAQRGIGIPVPDDTLFVHRWVYEWGLLFEYSIAAYWTGHLRAALGACDRLLGMRSLPQPYREQTTANRAYCVSALGGDAPARVTTTGDIPSVISVVPLG